MINQITVNQLLDKFSDIPAENDSSVLQYFYRMLCRIKHSNINGGLLKVTNSQYISEIIRRALI